MENRGNSATPEQEAELIRLQQELEEYRARYDAVLQRQEVLERELQEAQLNYYTISNAFFWKVTGPMRKALDALKRCFRTNGPARALWHALKGLKAGGVRSACTILYRQLIPQRYAMAPQYTPAEMQAQRKAAFPRKITFSIAVPLYNTPEKLLREMIGSVRKQTYGDWELCLADGSDDAHREVGRICMSLARKDPRIRYRKLEENLGISGNSNVCLEMASGDYIGLLDHDDILHPSALYEVMGAICDRGADFIYTDENTFRAKPSDAFNPHFKPDFGPDTLRGCNYICHFTVFKRSLLALTGGFRSEFDGSQDHDLVLRLTERAARIVHIPKVLYYWRACPGSVAGDVGAKPYVTKAGIHSVAAQLERLGLPGQVENVPQALTIYRVRYQLRGEPLISILIPSCDHVEVLERCLQSIYEKTTYPAFEILVIENNSRDAGTFAFYKRQEALHPNLRVLRWEGAFNYSAINNFGAQYASGEYLLLLNNDTEVITPGWLQELLMYAQRSDVGAVGAMLYYPDETVQHGGVILGIGGIAAHAFRGVPRGHVGYMGRLIFAQNLSAVTGACMLLPRRVWEEVGGLDPELPVAFNDVDLCLRLRRAGYLVVWTPFAELYHNESRSRGRDDDTPEKRQCFADACGTIHQRWDGVIRAGDPYYNPHFTLIREDFSLS